jgi:hypothetical protein
MYVKMMIEEVLKNMNVSVEVDVYTYEGCVTDVFGVYVRQVDLITQNGLFDFSRRGCELSAKGSKVIANQCRQYLDTEKGTEELNRALQVQWRG